MEQKQTIAQLRDVISADLKKIGLAEITIKNFRRCVDRFRKHIALMGLPDYYEQKIADEYLRQEYDYPACVAQKKVTVWQYTNSTAINRLAEYGHYGYIRADAREKKDDVGMWAGNDKPWVTQFLELDRKIGNSKNTTTVRYNALKQFYKYLIVKNISGAASVTTEILSDYATTREGYAINYVHQLLRNIQTYLKFLFTQGYIENDISQAVPKVKSRQNLNTPALWSKDELDQLLQSIDRGNSVGKRDYAILLLLIQYGIRASDVAGLQLKHLNWQNRTIEFAQRKTDKGVVYPILDDVGWALIEYLRDGRPSIENPYVFLTHFGTPKEFSGGGSLCSVLRKQMKRADIRKDIIHTTIGPHSLRHAVARRLVAENVDVYAAASILGDSTLKAASIYLRSDIDGLRECALDTIGLEVPYAD